jgi:hypothetical protein
MIVVNQPVSGKCEIGEFGLISKMPTLPKGISMRTKKDKFASFSCDEDFKTLHEEENHE